MSNETAVFTPVERTTVPKATASEDGAIYVRVGLNVEPDGHWERFFLDKYAQAEPGVKPTISRRDRNAHPGATGKFGPSIHFRIRTPDELAERTREIDAVIDAANQTYIEVHVPAEEVAAAAEKAREAEKAAIQADLDRIASELKPPGGDPKTTKRAPVRIPTRTPNPPRW